MKVLLCALTGFGNKVLDALIESQVEIIAVLTRKEPAPFPYYLEENLVDYARKKGVSVFEEFSWEEIEKIVRAEKPELLLVATFDKIIPQVILNLVPRKINLHPSLLPKYKGRKPIEAALENHETETGLTAHVISGEIDGGEIILQKRLPIAPEDTASVLRKKLAIEAGLMTAKLLKAKLLD